MRRSGSIGAGRRVGGDTLLNGSWEAVFRSHLEKVAGCLSLDGFFHDDNGDSTRTGRAKADPPRTGLAWTGTPV